MAATLAKRSVRQRLKKEGSAMPVSKMMLSGSKPVDKKLTPIPSPNKPLAL